MNKKFSTLVAVLLAAGAWTTLDAKVVEITTPAIGGSYVIGSALDNGSAVLLLADNANMANNQTVESTTGTWVMESAEVGYPGESAFYLKGAGGKFITAASSTATLTFETADEAGENSRSKVPFIINAEGDIAVLSSYANTDLQNKELKLTATSALVTAVEDGSFTAKFAVYGEDDYNGLPGLNEVAFDQNGTVTTITATTVGASFYFNDGTNYLSVTTNDDGDYVLVDEDQITSTPNAAQSLSASWKLEGGKLISVASALAGKPVALTAVNRTLSYSVAPVSSAPVFTVSGGVAKLGSTNLTNAALSVSSTVAPIADDVTIGLPNVANGVIIGGTYDLLTSVSSDYCLIRVAQSDNSVKFLKAGTTSGAATAAAFDAANYKSFLWKVSEQNDNDKIYRYTFTSLATDANKKAIKWLGVDGGTAQFVADAKYAGGFTLTHEGTAVAASGTVTGSTKATISFYEAPVAAKQESELNKIYDLGFEMTVKISKDGTETIEGIDVFGQKMYAISNGNAEASSISNATSVQLWNNEDKTAKGAKVLVLDVTEKVGNNDNSAVNGKFKWITAKELTDNATNYKSFFQFRYSAGKPNTTGVEQLAVMNDNGSLYSVAYILRVQEKYYLTSLVSGSITSDSKLPYINLGASNIYDVKKLLGQYLSFSYADTKANTPEAEQYKLGAMLAVTLNGTAVEADFITGTSAVLPEAQWAVTDADKDNNTFELTNRENKSKKLTGVQLRVVGNKFVMTANGGNGNANISNDLVTLTATALSKTTNFDGYMQSTPNALRNENYYLGQYHAVEGNNHAYFVENHTDKASHQIGMTAEKENAQKWNLHLATKADEDGKYTLVDTVKVSLAFATLIDNKIVNDPTNKDVVKDTLFILPYAFQNASNREFVSYKEGKGYNFYYCNEDYKDNSAVINDQVIKFALKMKPDNTYNFVELNMVVNGNGDAFGEDKVLGGNSANKGVISRVATYDQNANSLMVVEKADAPEYHKIEMAWGDTIKLFREENNSQVVYEKRDDKSVVLKDTLSFLNIDNINQFKLNPAIFADTAYINRTFANGELNTCYQYLLAVNVDPEKSYYCPYNPEHNTDEWRAEHNGPCADAKEHRAVYGRFLINLIDTANVYGAEHIHNNPYIDELEVGDDKRAKLSFVEGVHANDTLFITRQGGEVVKLGMDTPDFNVAKFAFRYVDAAAKTFKIQTQFKEYAPGTDEDDLYVSNDGYLRWINGALVVTEDFENGDVFGIEENYAGDPTANEDVTVSSISVAATNGAVIIKGAEGKKVSIVNVLGQTIANTVITSSEATIAAPAGVVVVSVEGEAAVKAIVK